MILAGDIGGTNTRIALFETIGSAIRPVITEVFKSAAHDSLESILAVFRAQHPTPVKAAAFGVAGPVLQGRCDTPNLAWDVDAASVARQLSLPAVGLVNDLEANAHGIGELAPDDFAVLQEGASDAAGNQGLIAAGTGLGEAGLLADGGAHEPFACEGGHCDFAPRDETEIALLRHLMARFGRVSYERVLSGPGLYNIYQFLRDTGVAVEEAWLTELLAQTDAPPVIVKAGLEGASQLCVKTLDMFVSLYGAEAGNLALKSMATGGMFVGGGIAPRILPKLTDGAFVNSFNDKGRLSTVLRMIPIRVILNDRTALLGAGRVAHAKRYEAWT